jgi:hypothetical protein
VYFVLKGSKGCTKKTAMKSYEFKKKDVDIFREGYFEYKADDVGKIEKVFLSINTTNNSNEYLYIDFIEIKIPSRSEAYK